jgi:hypothetical protein
VIKNIYLKVDEPIFQDPKPTPTHERDPSMGVLAPSKPNEKEQLKSNTIGAALFKGMFGLSGKTE